jgi:hypothetical protein
LIKIKAFFNYSKPLSPLFAKGIMVFKWGRAREVREKFNAGKQGIDER